MKEEKIPDRAYEKLLRWARKKKPGDKVFHSGREAVDYLKRLAAGPRIAQEF